MMRITNTIIANNSKYNVNSNKTSVDALNQQMSDQKRIHAPSEDPIIAIRSLRLRGALSQIDQYYTKNIPDAMSWLDVTETALTNMKGLIGSVAKQCTYGATDTLEKSDRQVILDDLLETRKQIYTEGNADYAGRTIFTGWKTQEYLTFQTDDLKTSYEITEKFKPEDLQDVTYITCANYGDSATSTNTGEVKYGSVSDTADSADVESLDVTRLVLGYDNIDLNNGETVTLDYTDANGNPQQITLTAMVGSDPYEISTTIYGRIKDFPDEAFIRPDTGEIIFGNNLKDQIRNAKDISITYNKTGFQKGELRPEHYYDCKKTKDEKGGDINPPTEYIKEDNDIDYTISFNQTIKINTEASDVFDSRMARYIDDMISALQGLDHADEKIATINKMIEDPAYKDEEVQEKLQNMLSAATKERDLWDDKVQKEFEKNIKVWQNYMDSINLAITDCGSRYARVELTETRMASQQTTFKKLKSTNEDRELSDIIIDYTSASTAYQSSLRATSRALQQTLLDYL